jgi:CubicO group peptidase (beta-lactamase class C family)
MPDNAVADFVEAKAMGLGLPGVAVGIWTHGREIYSCHGVTSIENPLPVDRNTLFVLGSVTKTFTATALMRLVAAGVVELDAPVRCYVPELMLADETAAASLTVSNLLNHTAGLDWRIDVDTGEGDEALAREVAEFSKLKLIAPPGFRASYSQAGYNLAGRILEKVTGKTYEGAIASLLLEPLGLANSFFSRDDIMTRRFALGHNLDGGGELVVARPWRHWRSDNPGAGLASSVTDQIRWARFHLGDGSADHGLRILPAQFLRRMQKPTVTLQGSSLGDAFGICWFLRCVNGVDTFGHGGSANGQFAKLLVVPDQDFAIVTMCNAGPDSGLAFNESITRWALEHFIGVRDEDPEPLPYNDLKAKEVVGSYENDMMSLTIGSDGTGLTIECSIKSKIRMAAENDPPPNLPPASLGLLPGGTDGYIITSGGLVGQRGVFTRDENNMIIGVDLAGRFFRRTPSANCDHACE